MSYLKLENNAKTVLASAITAGATSLTVLSATKFPASGDFLITIWDSVKYSDPGDDSNMEILKVTAVSGNTFTVTRAQESTTAKTHSKGNAVQMLITAGIIEEIQDAIKDNFSELDDTPSSYSGQGGKGVRVKGAEDGVEFYTTTDSDEKTKISANDTTPGYLNGKLIAGDGINLSEIGDGGDETLSIINADKGSDAISAHNITYDHSQLHAHANKTLLDTYTQTEVDIADAINKEHEHSNKTELDKITDGDHDVRIDNPHTVTKTQVGLSNVPNLDTTDAVANEHTQNTDNILKVDLSYIPDQSQSDTSDDGGAGGIGGSYSRQYAQTFIPIGNVNLYSVKLPIWFWDYGSGYDDFEVEIQTVDANKKPTGSVLGSKSLPYTSFTHNEYTTVEFVFPSLIALSVSTTYAIVCKSNIVSTGAYYIADCGGQNLYSDGRELTTIDGGSNWTEYSTRDLAFETYIEGVGIADLINDGTLKENLEVDSGKTIDGRDLSVDGTKLDTIETSAVALATVKADSDIADAITKKHTQGTDTTLGAMSADIDMNTHKIEGVVDPTADQEAATKKYVDDAVEVENLWDRADTTLSPHNANDSVDLGSGKIEAGGLNVFGDLVKTRNVTVGRTSGLVSSIAKAGGRTLTITRNSKTNGIESIADGTRTWTITRNGNDRMTAMAVA